MIIIIPGADLQSGSLIANVPLGNNLSLGIQVNGNINNGITGAASTLTYQLK